LGADFHLYFLAINNKSLLLKVRLPDFLGVALREADVMSELLSFARDFTYLHLIDPLIDLLKIQSVILEVLLLKVKHPMVLIFVILEVQCFQSYLVVI